VGHIARQEPDSAGLLQTQADGSVAHPTVTPHRPLEAAEQL